MHVRATRLAAVALLAVASLLPAMPTQAAILDGRPATAQADDPQPPPGGFPSWEALFAEQNKINNALLTIEAAAANAGDTNLAWSVADPNSRSLQLAWKGTPSAAVQTAITQQRQIVPITLTTTAPYSQALLFSEIDRITALSTGFQSVEVNGDNDGISIAWLEGRVDPQLQATIIATARVPVTFNSQPLPPDPPLAKSRQDDNAPYYGGARLKSVACSVGFSMNRPDGQKMLTAAHCGSVGTTVTDGGGQVMGKFEGRNSSRDIAYIGGSTMDGRVWDGGPQSTLSKAVARVVPLRVGNSVCVSGSFSGVVCGGKVTQLNVSLDNVVGLVRIEHTSGRALAGYGDSGGPVYSLNGSKVDAQGLVSKGAFGYSAPCSGEGGRTCYKRIHVASVEWALGYFNGGIRVG